MEKRIRGRVKKADGEEPARVLPERADEGHSEGTRRSGRAPNEIEELEAKIEDSGMSKEAKEKALAELNKLKLMSPMSPRRPWYAVTWIG